MHNESVKTSVKDQFALSQIVPNIVDNKPLIHDNLPTQLPITNDVDSQFKANSHFIFSSSATYFRIDSLDQATGLNAVFLSKLSPSLDFDWNIAWSDKIETFLGIGVQSFSIYNFDTSYALNNANQVKSNLRASVGYKVSPKVSLKFSGFLSEEIYNRAINTTTITIDTVQVPKFQVMPRFNLLETGTLSSGVEGILGIEAPISAGLYKIQTGTYWGAKLWGRQSIPLKNSGSRDASSLFFEGGLFYMRTSRNSNIVSETEQDLGLVFSAGWSFGK